jgi:hypothetical protein
MYGDSYIFTTLTRHFLLLIILDKTLVTLSKEVLLTLNNSHSRLFLTQQNLPINVIKTLPAK